MDKSLNESTQQSTGSICSSGFISKQKTLPRVQPIDASINQLNRSNIQTAKRTFNLLSNDSDSDDSEDNASGAFFNFDKNPIPIKRAKPQNTIVAQTKSNDDNDSQLFAFSNTASSQKLATQRSKPTTSKPNDQQPNRSSSRLCKTIMFNMQNMSIQPVQVTMTGWMTSSTIKKEEPFEDGEHSLLAAKTEADENGCDSKAWIDQIKCAFEVRTKKMHLVNRTVSKTSSALNVSTSSKNFKTFVKVCIFVYTKYNPTEFIFLFFAEKQFSGSIDYP